MSLKKILFFAFFIFLFGSYGHAFEVNFDDELSSLDKNNESSSDGSSVEADDILNDALSLEKSSSAEGSVEGLVSKFKAEREAMKKAEYNSDVEKMRKKCEPYWTQSSSEKICSQEEPVDPTISVGLVFTARPSQESWQSDCSRKYKSARAVSSCMKSKEERYERNLEKSRKKRRARLRRALENYQEELRTWKSFCAKEREMCTSSRDDILQGKLPKKEFPAWTPAKQAKFEEVSDSLNITVDKNTNFSEADQLERQYKEKQAASEREMKDRIRLDNQKAADREAKRAAECQKSLSQGIVYCSCVPYLTDPTKAKTCTQ